MSGQWRKGCILPAQVVSSSQPNPSSLEIPSHPDPERSFLPGQPILRGSSQLNPFLELSPLPPRPVSHSSQLNPFLQLAPPPPRPVSHSSQLNPFLAVVPPPPRPMSDSRKQNLFPEFEVVPARPASYSRQQNPFPELGVVPVRPASGSGSPHPNPFLEGPPLPDPVEKSDMDFFKLFYLMTSIKSSEKILTELAQDFRKLSADEQMDAFVLVTTANKAEMDKRLELIVELKLFLNQRYRKATVTTFGSMTTTLCGPDSDIDLVVDLFDTLRHKPGSTRGALRYVQLYLESGFIGDPDTPAYTIQSILEARIPILRLRHLATDLRLDLSFENYMSVRNSRLVCFYIGLDPRYRPLMLFIRYWAKFHGLVGSFKIKNYCLVLLIITFLASKGLLPTVEQLQELDDPTQDPSCIIDGWNAGFCHDMEKIISKLSWKPTPQRPLRWEAVLELIYEFFHMYSQMDFEANVICPFIGGTLRRDDFRPGQEARLPPSMGRYRAWAVHRGFNSRLRLGPFNVQDPFHHGHNVGAVTSLAICSTFRAGCIQMVEVIKSFQAENITPKLLDFFLVPLSTIIAH